LGGICTVNCFYASMVKKTAPFHDQGTGPVASSSYYLQWDQHHNIRLRKRGTPMSTIFLAGRRGCCGMSYQLPG
jgi:hypothetical protein